MRTPSLQARGLASVARICARPSASLRAHASGCGLPSAAAAWVRAGPSATVAGPNSTARGLLPSRSRNRPVRVPLRPRVWRQTTAWVSLQAVELPVARRSPTLAFSVEAMKANPLGRSTRHEPSRGRRFLDRFFYGADGS